MPIHTAAVAVDDVLDLMLIPQSRKPGVHARIVAQPIVGPHFGIAVDPTLPDHDEAAFSTETEESRVSSSGNPGNAPDTRGGWPVRAESGSPW